jgi:Putative bacterial sensory transduction regulator
VDAGPARIALWLEEIGAAAERPGPREWVVQVPSDKRGAVAVALSAGERTLSLRAFVMRGPDRAHEAVYRRMLQKSMASVPWAFALDGAGDVFLVARMLLGELSAAFLDQLLGALASVVDETYESLVRTGFDVPEGTEFRPPPAP